VRELLERLEFLQAESVAARQALSVEGEARLAGVEAEAGGHARAAVQAAEALRQAREALACGAPAWSTWPSCRRHGSPLAARRAWGCPPH